MRGAFRIGRVRGIPIALSPSWFVALVLVVATLAIRVYPDVLPDYRRSTHWLLAMAGALLFFVSILLHELAHSLVALRLGLPVKGITLFIFGGVSQIHRDAPRARTELLIAVVGPLTSLLIGGLSFGLWFAVARDQENPLAVQLELLLLTNLALGLFNLAPAFPMDGGRILRAVLWTIGGDFLHATRWASYAGRALAYALVAIGFLSFLDPGFWPLRVDQVGGLWFMLVGLFLDTSARMSYAQARVLHVLRSHRVDEAMSRDLATIGRGLALEDVVQAYMTSEGKACLFVTNEAGAVVGVVTPREVRGVPRERWMDVHVGEVMLAAERVPVTHPESDMASTLQRMDLDELFQLPVVDQGRLIGIIDRVHIMQFVQRLGTRKA